LAGRIVVLEAKTLDGTTVMTASGTLASVESGRTARWSHLKAAQTLDCGAYVLRDEFRSADWNPSRR
jgi:hypothetical protein